ncbi:hypothetical protein B0I35DRAFT_420766 [Stachybotrys elegans]|uniref:Zn(2)-C6 fungal-type domain-containing protein n=1 Tax=Stachybotrys elegans TaxID=80388 RepID=A0A8K0SYA0_9HYPO|nr:hypothetical protein B0I35DRAFT_420766 [Stachybotrys elegans]
MQEHARRPLAQRSACDRCREKKLRCPRVQVQGSETCVRCARASVTCVTGAPRPLGRSRISANNTCKPQAPRTPRHSVFISVNLSKPTPQVSSASTSELETATDSTKAGESALERTSSLERTMRRSNSVQDSLNIDSELFNMFFDDGLSSSETPDTFAGTLDLTSSNDVATQADLIGAHNHGISSLDASIHDEGQSISHLSQINDPGFYLNGPSQNQSILGSPMLMGPSVFSSHILVRLARLNEGLAQQLCQVDTFILSIPPPSLTQSCVDKAGDLQVNPVLPALKSTSELTAIINYITSHIQDNRSSLLSTPIVLMCVSAHIQLLQIFNSIFEHVHRFMSRIHDVLGLFEKSPGFTQMSGFPAMRADLYIKIVIQVVQHHISDVDRAIGLPVDMRLSSQGALSKGLLDYLDSSDLAQTLMDQACHPSEKSGRDLVASLRIGIRNVLGLIQDVA